jgi:hypothetical protein
MRLPGTETDSWVEHEGCETPKYAVLRTGKRSERTLQRKLVFRENTVDSEIRAVLAEYRGEFPISVGLCHEDRQMPMTATRHAAYGSSTRFEQYRLSCIGYAGESYFERFGLELRTME